MQIVFASGGKAMSSLTYDRKVSLTFSVLLERRLAHLFTSIWDKEEKRNEPSDCNSITYWNLKVCTVPEGACPDGHNRLQQ